MNNECFTRLLQALFVNVRLYCKLTLLMTVKEAKVHRVVLLLEYEREEGERFKQVTHVKHFHAKFKRLNIVMLTGCYLYYYYG